MCVAGFPFDVRALLILVVEEGGRQRSDRGKYIRFVSPKSLGFLIFLFSVDHRRRDGRTRKVRRLQLPYAQTVIP
jgi:hypothetical protein